MQHFRRPIAVRRAALATAVGLIATWREGLSVSELQRGRPEALPEPGAP